jgi:hypothetical protein
MTAFRRSCPRGCSAGQIAYRARAGGVQGTFRGGPSSTTICSVESAPSDHGDDAELGNVPSTERSWLLGFIRADVLALTATVAAGATVLGLPALNLGFSAYAFHRRCCQRVGRTFPFLWGRVSPSWPGSSGFTAPVLRQPPAGWEFFLGAPRSSVSP